jgi:hypothetical protein
MKDEADLTARERALGYHNPARGDYRLGVLRGLLQRTLSARSVEDPHGVNGGQTPATRLAGLQPTA